MTAPRLALLALAVFAGPLAAKPGALLDPDQARYRSDAIALCVGQIGSAEGADPNDVEALCRCAADRFLTGRDISALPAAAPSGMPTGMGPEVLRCLSEIRPDAAGALAAAAMRPPAPPAADTSAPTVVAPDKPVADEATASPSGPGILERIGSLLDGLSLSGLPRWAWGLGALAGILFLRRLFRRPERDDDLMGPPRPEHYRNLPRY